MGGTPQFASRYGDPTQQSGGLISLASGGLLGGRRKDRSDRRQIRRTRRNDSRNGQRGGPIRGGVKRIMKQVSTPIPPSERKPSNIELTVLPCRTFYI